MVLATLAMEAPNKGDDGVGRFQPEIDPGALLMRDVPTPSLTVFFLITYTTGHFVPSFTFLFILHMMLIFPWFFLTTAELCTWDR